MNLRGPTIDKFQKFLDTRSAAKQHFADEEEKLEPKPEPKPEQIVYQDPGPPPYKGKKIAMPDDLLGELNKLSKKFASKGYRLDCTLTLQKLP